MKNTARLMDPRILIGLLGALLAVGSPTLASAQTPEDLQLVYHATFGNGSFDSGIDPLGIGWLRPGDSEVVNSNPTWTADEGTIVLGTTRPLTTVVGPVTAGLFATPVNFDQGSVVGLRATFVAPAGPHDVGNQWAVTVSARTGAEGDVSAETRTAATFQVRANGARLNVVGASAQANQLNVPQEVYDAVFDPIDPQPFTLELLIDRVSGVSWAALKIGNWTASHTFLPAAFLANSGPSITAVGVSVAISNAPGQTASVTVRDFQIFSVKRNSQ